MFFFKYSVACEFEKVFSYYLPSSLSSLLTLKIKFLFIFVIIVIIPWYVWTEQNILHIVLKVMNKVRLNIKKIVVSNLSSISKFAWSDINVLNGKILLKEIHTEKTEDIE